MKAIYKIFIICFLVLLSGCGEKIIFSRPDSELNGKKIVFKTPMVYAQNWKRTLADKEAYKYNRYLMREKDSYVPYDHHYKSGEKELFPIRNGMRFTVRKNYRVVPRGIQRAFSNELTMLVLEDEDSLLSTFPASDVSPDEWENE